MSAFNVAIEPVPPTTYRLHLTGLSEPVHGVVHGDLSAVVTGVGHLDSPTTRSLSETEAVRVALAIYASASGRPPAHLYLLRAMSVEETYYWLSLCMSSDRAKAGRAALKALLS